MAHRKLHKLMINILNNQKLRITIDFTPENMKNIINVKIANKTKQLLLTILYMYFYFTAIWMTLYFLQLL